MNTLLGISVYKMTSILFLLIAIFIALILNSVDFLINNNPVSLPSVYEGHTGVKHEDQ